MKTPKKVSSGFKLESLMTNTVLSPLMDLIQRRDSHVIETSMEPLYPQNILERTFPILREKREKAEREAVSNPEVEREPEAKIDWEEITLYEEIPYAGGPSGKNLNTFA